MYDTSEGILPLLEGHDYDKVRKGLVSLAIEKVLLDIGSRTLYKVNDELKKRYQCYLPDCYDHPEYLSAILKNLYGISYKQVSKSINKQLEDFSYHEPIARFLKVICQ